MLVSVVSLFSRFKLRFGSVFTSWCCFLVLTFVWGYVSHVYLLASIVLFLFSFFKNTKSLFRQSEGTVSGLKNPVIGWGCTASFSRDSVYVGQTARCVNTRLTEHKGNVRR